MIDQAQAIALLDQLENSLENIGRILNKLEESRDIPIERRVWIGSPNYEAIQELRIYIKVKT